MTPLSSPLSQYWQTVVERLPEGFTETSLSVQAKSVLTFSDFALDSVIAHQVACRTGIRIAAG